nr:hypothetical protein [Tanacetum cinerariifolium]
IKADPPAAKLEPIRSDHNQGDSLGDPYEPDKKAMHSVSFEQEDGLNKPQRRFVVIWEVNGRRFGEEEGDSKMYVQEEGEDRGKKILYCDALVVYTPENNGSKSISINISRPDTSLLDSLGIKYVLVPGTRAD